MLLLHAPGNGEQFYFGFLWVRMRGNVRENVRCGETRKPFFAEIKYICKIERNEDENRKAKTKKKVASPFFTHIRRTRRG